METLTLATAQKLIEAARDPLNPMRAEAAQSLILGYADATDAVGMFADAATRGLLARHLSCDV